MALDLPNVHIGAQGEATADGTYKRNLALRLKIVPTADLIRGIDARGLPRKVAHQYAATSSRFQCLVPTWESAGFTVRTLPLGPNGKEVGVDEALHATISNWLLRESNRQAQHVLVLVTGDGNGNRGFTSFIDVIENAARKGWRVEIYSWRACTSDRIKNLADLHGDRIQLKYLDRWRYHLVCNAKKPPPAAARSRVPWRCMSLVTLFGAGIGAHFYPIAIASAMAKVQAAAGALLALVKFVPRISWRQR